MTITELPIGTTDNATLDNLKLTGEPTENHLRYVLNNWLYGRQVKLNPEWAELTTASLLELLLANLASNSGAYTMNEPDWEENIDVLYEVDIPNRPIAIRVIKAKIESVNRGKTRFTTDEEE